MIYNEEIIKKIDSYNGTYKYSELYQYLQELINSGMSIKEISDRFKNLPTYHIIDCLLRYQSNEQIHPSVVLENTAINLTAIKSYYNNIKIDTHRCLIIADTHIGRLETNEDINKGFYDKEKLYLNEKGILIAYNYATINGINNIIHLGDLIEGNSDHDRYRLVANPYQFQYLEKVYSILRQYVGNQKTYLLFGNHDYNLIFYNGITPDFYKVCSNVELIGVNYSYINFCGNRIKLSHQCNASSHLKNVELEHSFEMAGHSHTYSQDEENRYIRIPSLACTPSYINNAAFIELIDEENEYLFKYITTNGTEVPNREFRLSKVIKQ